MGLCLWMSRDSKILKSVTLFDEPMIEKLRICMSELSNTTLAWLGNRDVRSRTNFSYISRTNVVLIIYKYEYLYTTQSQDTRGVVLKRNKEDMLCLSVRTILGVTLRLCI